MAQDENAKTYPRNFTETIIKSIAVRITCSDVEYRAMKEELIRKAEKKIQKRCGKCGGKRPKCDRGIWCCKCKANLCYECSLSTWDGNICRVCAADMPKN